MDLDSRGLVDSLCVSAGIQFPKTEIGLLTLGGC